MKERMLREIPSKQQKCNSHKMMAIAHLTNPIVLYPITLYNLNHLVQTRSPRQNQTVPTHSFYYL